MEPGFYEETFLQETRSWWHRGRREVLAAVLSAALAETDVDIVPGEAGVGGIAPPPGETAAPTRRSLLDVGCGTGGTTRHLAGGMSVVGCDAAADALHLARRRGLDCLVQADASSLPFRDGAFDVALSLDVIEHHDDDAEVVAELHRVLRPSGLLLATVPAFDALWGPHDVLSHHRRRYRLRPFVGLLEGAGFRVERAGYFNTLIFPAVLALQTARRIARRGAEPEPASDLPRRMPAVVNAGLARLFALERHAVNRWRLPFGVSLFATARRVPETA